MSFKFCSIASGSSGNCQYIETDKAKILVDAGLSGKKIQAGLDLIGVDPNSLNGILVTHEHKDHIQGVGILSRRFNIPIYANNNTWEVMREYLGKLKEENIKIIKNNGDFEIGNLGINTFSTSHDAIDSMGYNFNYKNKKVSIVTDTGVITDNIKSKIQDSDLLFLESNHDVEMLKVGSYPYYLKKRVLSHEGHLSNEDAGNLLAEIFQGRFQKIFLAHLSRENNFPELAYQTVVNIMTAKGIKINKDIEIDIAHRHQPTVFCTI
ncbi:MBL fold metallo-hydrolase [Clostridium sp. D2Q-11]|uniref:MBL fold metallo-hydrolase n=1 Tax=Anaeromonas frigoriresistens TaxID=2683708 RepID=A0A942Z7B4_9FIRM|nr:MBL fold metallo-hydrolase [Anaeromonas frigoriresistens]MBS4538507.1 MBL fold metallo-hydrolase [Anaeromonas frigoriresistens]